MLVEHGAVAGMAHVRGHGVRQPQQIVRAPRPGAAAGRRMPPVLHVAVDELPRRRAQQVRPAQIGPRVQQRHHVLQLIAEAERAAGLIGAAAGPDAAAQRLIQQPAVHQQIERVVWRVHLHSPQRVVPELRRPSQRGARPRRSSRTARRAPTRAPRRAPGRGRTQSAAISPGGISTTICSAAQASRPAPALPCRALRDSAAGRASVLLRPMNSVRSQVDERAGSVACKNATRCANSWL